MTTLLGSVTAGFAFGLVVLAAPESTDPHDDWDAGTEMIHAGPDSIYVSVRPVASGLVRIDCIEGQPVGETLGLRFSGNLSLPSQRLRIYDPNDTVQILLAMPDGNPVVQIFSDEPDEASTLRIYVLGTREIDERLTDSDHGA